MPFRETTFTDKEFKALRTIIEFARSCDELVEDAIRNSTYGPAQAIRALLLNLLTFKLDTGNQTFTDQEMEILFSIVKYSRSRCGGGEDTIGLILYSGAVNFFTPNTGQVVDFAEKIDPITYV